MTKLPKSVCFGRKVTVCVWCVGKKGRKEEKKGEKRKKEEKRGGGGSVHDRSTEQKPLKQVFPQNFLAPRRIALLYWVQKHNLFLICFFIIIVSIISHSFPGFLRLFIVQSVNYLISLVSSNFPYLGRSFAFLELFF